MSGSAALWRAVEALHGVVYYTPDARPAFQQLGLSGYWMGYFASRSCPMGQVDAAPVQAAFYNFAPDMVGRALPEAWRRTTPESVLAVRRRLASDALAAAGLAPDKPTARAADELLAAASSLELGGRVLAASNAALPPPSGALERLWHAVTVAREYRGDGHVIALANLGVTGLDAHLLHGATGALPESQRQLRGWTEHEWASARADLARRGLLDARGALTDAGRALHRHVQADTDRLSSSLPEELGRSAGDAGDFLLGLARTVARAGTVPYPNAMGVLAP